MYFNYIKRLLVIKECYEPPLPPNKYKAEQIENKLLFLKCQGGKFKG